MARSELYLLLPVYREVEGQPHYIKRIDIISDADFKRFMEKIEDVWTFFGYENYNGYYDAINVHAFLSPVETMEECYPNGITRFRSILNKWGENWRKDKKQDDAEQYMYYCMAIQDDTLCEIAKRKSTTSNDNTFLLINHNAISCANGLIRSKCGNKEVEIVVSDPEVKAIAHWFEHNRRPQRKFNWNPKHGEYGKGAEPSNKGDKVSVLMCSRAEAGLLLQKAIGVDLRRLHFFDDKYNQYIEFKWESENTYHAFHLDVEDENRVPAIVKESIKRLVEEIS